MPQTTKQNPVVPGQTAANYPPISNGVSHLSDVRIVDKVYLTLDEASTLAGLSKDYLQAKIASGHLKAISDGEEKVRRSDLEKL